MTDNKHAEAVEVTQADREVVKFILGETCHTSIGYKIDRDLAYTAEVERVARHRLAALNTRPDVEAWQPIETASKEVWQRSQQVLCAHSEKRWIRFGRYYGELKRWYYSGTNERSQWAETPGDAPTHWQPMPAIRSIPVPTSGEGGADHG